MHGQNHIKFNDVLPSSLF